MRKIYFILLFGLLIWVTNLVARNKPVAVIPFEMVGKYVVVKVRINDSSPLRFILDSGVRRTIVTELFPEDNLSLVYDDQRQIQGLGQGLTLDAAESKSNKIVLNRKISISDKTIFVLKEDIFNLTRQTGTKINGLLGFDFFSDYITEIDYSKRKIKFYKRESFVPPSDFGRMPMTIENQKMYIQLSILETVSERRAIKMFIDTGAELSAWFQTLTNKAIEIPEKSIQGRIGQGFSGEITGYFARVPQICIANFCVKDPVVAFPEPAAISEIIKNSDRDGTIGSQLLSRFDLIIDVFSKNFYFKPNRNFKKPFVYNIAGIEVLQTLIQLSYFEVVNVWNDSPAQKAGVKTGDIVLEINNVNIFKYSLSELRGYFEKPSKRPLQLLLSRDGKKILVKINMEAKI
jgi:hypothetical protein